MRMKAAILFEQGRPRPYADTRPLVVEEVELDPPGPGEILIEVAAAGLCHRPLRRGAGRPPHGRRAQHQHALRGHAQDHRVGRH